MLQFEATTSIQIYRVGQKYIYSLESVWHLLTVYAQIIVRQHCYFSAFYLLTYLLFTRNLQLAGVSAHLLD